VSRRAPLSGGGGAHHVDSMSGFFAILMILAMAAVLASLGIGLFAMVRGGEFGKAYSNRMMRYRVVLQGAALLFFALAMLSQAG